MIDMVCLVSKLFSFSCNSFITPQKKKNVAKLEVVLLYMLPHFRSFWLFFAK